MRKKVYAIILFLLVVTYEIVLGKETNKIKHHKNNKKHNFTNEKSNIERLKRSLDNEEDKPFWANRGKKELGSDNHNKNVNDIEKATKVQVQVRSNYFEHEPFWGARGRRQSASTENDEYDEYTEHPIDQPNCKNCFGTVHFDTNDKNFKDRRDETYAPFWGNRGRRSSDEVSENYPFWGNRGRRQDSQNEPFWGTRGRRTDSPFWGARGRREDEPFWGNRGRRNEEPFWGSRGRRDEPEPFWGSRGRRQDSQPFWGNRGRRDDEPFWGNRGRPRETEPFWGSRGRRKEDLKESIMNAINLVENDIEHLSRLRRSDSGSYWSNRGRESQLKNLFNSHARNRLVPQKLGREFYMDLKADPGTVHDSRIFAEEPHYIVVERSSRSSGESEDPFFISRGKKYYLNYNLIKAARDRRGAIEEIVKTVRNDPYYIARGKKDNDNVAMGTKINTTSEEEFIKVKELICAAIELVNSQQHNGKVKREIDNDRDRRSMLKKLAAQLQMDPYYVSRGKKSENSTNKMNLLAFVTEVAEKCD